MSGTKLLRGWRSTVPLVAPLPIAQLLTARERGHARAGAGLALRVHEVAQRFDETVDLGFSVSEADQGHDPAMVDQLDVDLPLIAQPVVGGKAGEPDRGRLDHHVG